MIEAASAPWLLRPSGDWGELRLLVRLASREASPGEPWEVDPQQLGLSADDLSLTWAGERRAPRALRPTRLGRGLCVARFADLPWPRSGLHYQVACGARRTPPIAIPPDPPPGEPWRFLLLSDHQQKPGVPATLAAVRRLATRRTFHGMLFAGDLCGIPDDPTAWCGRGDDRSFFDSLAAPVASLYRATQPPRLPGSDLPPRPLLISTMPLVSCIGNHEVSSLSGATPRERFLRVSPADWNHDTYMRLFHPGPDAICFAQRLGPLRLISLFVSRCWFRGEHETRSGPCYEPPGRFIFESIDPGSCQYVWLQREVARDLVRAPAVGEASPWLRIVLMHHGPYAQGHNSLPLFGEPVAYREHKITEHLMPLLEPWADLVISGHNHAVNHHELGGIHFLESSHIGVGYPPARTQAGGSAAREPLGHPSRFFLSEEGATFFATLEVRVDPGGRQGRVTIYRVLAGGACESEYAFVL
ncbi:MAG: hypothetical protein GF330_08870 [Candidatus Eisenbacteria bacterium]|nr:hypothetical protein [Candidatus Eisenbacteria bacterium]